MGQYLSESRTELKGNTALVQERTIQSLLKHLLYPYRIRVNSLFFFYPYNCVKTEASTNLNIKNSLG